MPFMIETWDKDGNHALRLKLRDRHLDYLDQHQTLLLACGAKLSDDGAFASGGIYLVDVEDRASAEDFIQNDPFHEAGLFQRVEVIRWRKAYLAGKREL
ncbi:hypothetical protein DSM14862_03715 (plasmid) [Sulfitobacter indolifex]|uniref:YCII-related domain-containing protein n=1 Tax=Sulfitobacter indolifex HEL-45 TaxID=391624 RepID=A0ABM9X1K6_9RHOB|nr:YciI family protein [Sulfitobacter indolifex]EDQ03222.1 hypothetical protein OIHEL45_20156 [Sulfitobacter indolifex HEL-45]UOA20554.1 hypothetical protein DSM14862_03392 [Sulfitobacter indolifex]UOA20877.1 hypothetical protein DSM14862_03715 [Sulfitobacter indolifex]